MPGKRDSDLWRCAERIAAEFKLEHVPDGKTTYVDVFYALLAREVIEIGPHLFESVTGHVCELAD